MPERLHPLLVTRVPSMSVTNNARAGAGIRSPSPPPGMSLSGELSQGGNGVATDGAALNGTKADCGLGKPAVASQNGTQPQSVEMPVPAQG
jgi:hypothetical protein